MSREIIEAVFACSAKHILPLMLICSRNQVDKDSGYVFTTAAYSRFVSEMRQRYPLASVTLCRDHCGPGFGPADNSLESVWQTMLCDMENGFELIHIDLCHLAVSRGEKITITNELMDRALAMDSRIQFEVGTEENVGVPASNLAEIADDLAGLHTKPKFYVVQTGSLVKEDRNYGTFGREAVLKAKELLAGHGVMLKEHNADYLDQEAIRQRIGVVDAMNIAPQLGVIQTNLVLNACRVYGLDSRPFKQLVYRGGKWRKWLLNATAENRDLCVSLAGHYHFDSDEYRRLTDALPDVGIGAATEQLILHYWTSSTKGKNADGSQAVG